MPPGSAPAAGRHVWPDGDDQKGPPTRLGTTGGLGLGAASAPRPRFCAGRRPACPNPTRPFVRNCGNPFGQKPPLTWPFVRNVRKPLQTETASDLGFCAEPKIQKPPLTWAFVRNS